jgi:2-dehydropantoate 2-reductase
MANPSAQPILIVGSGALGCLFAARLSAAGHPVGMLGTWPQGVAALQERGVTLVGSDGGRQSFPVQASADPRDFFGSKQALVLVKAWQTQRAAGQLFEALAVDGLALTLQNGLGNREQLAARLGAERVATGVITTGATLLGPGVVRWAGEGQITLGNHPGLGSLPLALKGAGFAVETVEDVNSVAWSKLVINAAINPLTALLGVPNGDLLRRPTARALSAALATEVATVAARKEIALTFADPVAAAESVGQGTAANLSSMLQDVRRGAPTEIDAICGEVVRTGRACGVPTPLNEVMWQLVSAMRGQA